MSTESTNVTSLKKETPSVADEVRAKIVAIAAGATADDKKKVAEIIARAKKAKRDAGVFTITAAVAAILFLQHNPHNRDWRPEGPKSCGEYARRMSTQQWKFNNASIGFYVDGQLEDGQHRLSALAIAGHSADVAVVFGIERDAVVTVDDGLGRHGADHAKMDGIRDSKVKQTIIKIATAYMAKSGDKTAVLRSEAEVAASIKSNNELLDEAIEIGSASSRNVVDPVLKGATAQTIAYLMLTSAWEPQRIREKLALFQTGVSTDGEKTPYFVAGEVIKSARKRVEAKDRLNTVKEIGVAVFAMIAAERGVKALTAGSVRGAVKKELPSPAWPGEAMSEAA